MALHPKDKEFCEEYMRELEEKRMEDVNKLSNQICIDAIGEVAALKEQLLKKNKIIEKMREALKFYADKDNFTLIKYNGLSGFEAKLVNIHFEINGQPIWEKARQCLEETKGE